MFRNPWKMQGMKMGWAECHMVGAKSFFWHKMQGHVCCCPDRLWFHWLGSLLRAKSEFKFNTYSCWEDLRGVFAVCMYLRLSASEWSRRLKVLTCFAMFCCLSGSLCISTTVSCRRRTKCEPRTTTSQMKLQRCCDPWPLKTFDL